MVVGTFLENASGIPPLSSVGVTADHGDSSCTKQTTGLVFVEASSRRPFPFEALHNWVASRYHITVDLFIS